MPHAADSPARPVCSVSTNTKPRGAPAQGRSLGRWRGAGSGDGGTIPLPAWGPLPSAPVGFLQCTSAHGSAGEEEEDIKLEADRGEKGLGHLFFFFFWQHLAVKSA